MLKELNLNQSMTKETYQTLMQELKPELTRLQQRIKQLGIPVIILFEGPRAAGKVTALASLILNFDPRGFWVYSIRDAETDELRKPWIWRFAKKTPARGEIALFDHSWYYGMRLAKKSREGELYPGYLKDINVMERQLADDGCIILKYFLYIDKKEQKKRFAKLSSKKATQWQVTEQDFDNLRHYKQNQRLFEKMLRKTNTEYAPWHIIPSTDRRYSKAAIFSSVVDHLKQAISSKEQQERYDNHKQKDPTSFQLLPSCSIANYNTTLQIPKEEYRQQKEELQARLRILHSKLYNKRIPVVVCYEGNDAAGKGGNIKRLAQALDPRGYSVIPIGAPSETDLSHHYLWRFLRGLPRTGHISIFDRTWYGRVLVERVEGLIDTSTVQRAYSEINEFEYMLHKWGAILLKFWVAVSKEEQLARFHARQDTPDKQWKITEEDWRNREKWDEYVLAIDDMFRYTNTTFAPWLIVESDCKDYARLKTMRALAHAIEQRL